LEEGYRFYLPDEARRADPYASPLLAPSLAGLPRAFVLTCEYDPLRDEGEAYARRLSEAGVAARLVRARGHVHSSTYAPRWPRSARRYRHLCAEALRRAYGRT
jgi:acetyl esterase